MNTKNGAGLNCLASALCRRIAVRDYRIKTNKIRKPVRIVLVSDLHGCVYGKNQRMLLNKIAQQNPDIVVMAGDIFDEDMPETGTKMYLEGIYGKYPCFFVTGNHEFLTGKANLVVQSLRNSGITVLEGGLEEITVNGQRITVCGVDDPYCGDKEFSQELEIFSSLCTNNFTVLLSHRPELIDEFQKYNFDLVLSGHAHGGQWRIPFLINGVLAPDQGWFPRYAGGLYKHGSLIHIVGRGLAKHKKTPRIFNPPELVVVDIEPK